MLDHHAAMSRLLLRALGLACASFAALQGCGAKVVFDGEGSGASDTGGSGAGVGTGAGTSNTGGAGTGASTGQFTTGGFGTGGAGPCVPPSSTMDLGQPPAGCDFFFAQRVCFAGQSCASITQSCALEAYECGFQSVGDQVCTVEETMDGCCFVVTGDCPVGRPFFVGGVARSAALVAGSGWARPIAIDTSALSGAARAALIEVWQREASSEHASIASFARFVMALLAAGAPAELVREAQQALADEQEHTAICLGLAEAYGGPALRPGPLAIDGALDDSAELASLAAATAREGCVAETIAALQLASARDAADDPALRAVLAGMADQESAHAALAWRFVAWALEAGGAPVREAVTAVFDEAHAHVGFGAMSEQRAPDEELRRHGYLAIEERRALAAAALRDVVLPTARTLLARGSTVASQPLALHGV